MVSSSIVLIFLGIYSSSFGKPVVRDTDISTRVDALKRDVIAQYKRVESLLSKNGFDLGNLPEHDENQLHQEMQVLEGKVETLKELRKSKELSEIFDNDEMEMAIFLLDFGNLMEDFGNFFDYVRITENGGDDAVEEIREVYGHDSIGRMTVFRWLKKFRNGDKNVDDLEDDPRSGKPSKFNEKCYAKNPSLNDELATMNERIEFMKTTIESLQKRLQFLESQPTTSQKAKVFEQPMKYAERFPNFAKIVVDTIKFQEMTDKNPEKLLPLIDELQDELEALPKSEDDPMNQRLEAMLAGLKRMKQKLRNKLAARSV